MVIMNTCVIHDYLQGSYGVWKSMEFDLSIFQVWKSMENRKRSMEKYLCFQTFAPISFFYNRKFKM